MKKIILGSFLPIITMIVISLLSFNNIITTSLGLSMLDINDIYVSGIVLYIPISFLLSGIICMIMQIDLKHSVIISLLGSAIILRLLGFGSTGIISYVAYYLVTFCIGYFISIIIKRYKESNKISEEL
ncbi:hypothetical protein KQI18_09865 [Clostridioides mangenotii]|uniref:hypothetical protein n=1 Tax=Metaclostridioides mangenotii TaxID=1540 RepID=UPI001C106304|nr:hypothetical protein [Clostridioides mangenotii]MBU5308083.1 hypothetical protein [Clostridioides mangenotii]